MRKHEWEFRSLPNSPEGEEKGWERMDTSASGNDNSDSNIDSESEGITLGSNAVRQEAMNRKIMDDNNSDDEPTRKPTSKRGTRRMSTEELIVDAQAKQATQAQEAQAALIKMLATSQSAAMGTLAKAMDRTSKPVPLNTSLVVDKVGHEVY